MPICPACKQVAPAEAKECSGCGASLGPVERTGSQAAAALVGKTINGKYKVRSVLGEGGMGIVFKVQHLLFEKGGAFALKILHPKYSARRSFHSRFLREVEIAMKLTHECIIQIRDFGVTEDRHLFYTMDFFEGESLKEALHREERLSPTRVACIARKLLHALAEAQRVGIIHRDLKPDNILIHPHPDGFDNVRILDFGIAKLLSEADDDIESSLTGAGRVLGTPKYMSPEQAAGQTLDVRSDLYSLGVVLYELLVGRPPFLAPTTRALMCAHMTEPPLPFSRVAPGLQVPPALEALVFRLLAKDPERRPAGAEQSLALLGPASDGTPSSVASPGASGAPRSPAASAPGPRARRWRRTTLGGVTALAATALAWLGLHDRVAEALGPAGRSREPPRAVEPSAAASVSPTPPGAAAPLSTPASAEGAAPPPAPPPPARFQCLTCGTTYRAGEKDGGLCHGEPLVEIK